MALALPLLAALALTQADPAPGPERTFLEGKALLDSGDAAALDRAISLLEAAVKARDGDARWHHVLGLAYGRKAQTGMLAGARYAGKVKAEFERAVALEPSYLPARRGLMEFYLAAPAIMGGSEARAEEQAREIEKLDRFAGAVAWAALHRKRGEWEAYLRQVDEAARLADGPEQRRRLAGSLNAHGYRLLADGKPERALEVFRRSVVAVPDDPNAHDSLGEALLATRDWADAARSYQRSLDLGAEGNVREASRLGLGLALEGLGDVAGARKAYGAVLSEPPVKPERAAKARDRLAALERR